MESFSISDYSLLAMFSKAAAVPLPLHPHPSHLSSLTNFPVKFASIVVHPATPTLAALLHAELEHDHI